MIYIYAQAHKSNGRYYEVISLTLDRARIIETDGHTSVSDAW